METQTKSECAYWVSIVAMPSDMRWATWLQQRLESYRLPSVLEEKLDSLGAEPKRRGKALLLSLENGAKLEAIEDQLKRSRFLVVVCSPDAANSSDMDQMIRSFKRLEREHRVQCLIVAGEAYASSRLEPEGEECLPRAIKYEVDKDGSINDTPAAPAAADIRAHREGRRNAFLKILSGLFRLEFEEMKDRDFEEQQRKSFHIMLIVAALVVLLGLTSLFLLINAREAHFAADAAEERASQLEIDLNGARLDLEKLKGDPSK
ncbi:hypothetical protein N9B94_03395 [Verrucomicrobia bacterium]|nr:hypothetical protein [Verrucomicrobiota bacterium]